MAAEPLSTPLSIAINNSLKCNIFPSNVKIACVKPLNKKAEDKRLCFKFSTSEYFKQLKDFGKIC